MILDFWRFVIETKIAKTGCWYVGKKEDNEKVCLLGLIRLDKDGQRAYQIFIGKLFIMFGYVKRE